MTSPKTTEWLGAIDLPFSNTFISILRAYSTEKFFTETKLN